MGMLGTFAKGAVLTAIVQRLTGKKRRSRFGRRAAYGGFGRATGFGYGGLAAPIALSLGGWAYRKWKARNHASAPAGGTSHVSH